MMRTASVRVYALKSTRKNSKCELKEFMIFPDSKKLKHRFTRGNLMELREWCEYMVNHNGYIYFQFTVTDNFEDCDNFVYVHDFQMQPFDSINKLCDAVKRFFYLYNHVAVPVEDDQYAAEA